MAATRAARGLAVVAILALVVARPTAARADNIDVLIKDAKSGSDYKVRLAAVLGLAKVGDKRGIPALIGALGDSDKTVRGAAAVALGKLITAATPATTRGQAKTALEKLLAKESTDSVKKVAQKTLDQLAALEAASSAVTTGGIYVFVDKMASKAEPVEELRKLMRKTRADLGAEQEGQGLHADLAGRQGADQEGPDRQVGPGFYVDGTVNESRSNKKARRPLVSCKINMLIATYPEKSIFGLLDRHRQRRRLERRPRHRARQAGLRRGGRRGPGGESKVIPDHPTSKAGPNP
jgi:hypothetical protein